LSQQTIAALEAALDLLNFVHEAEVIIPGGDRLQPDSMALYDQLTAALNALRQQPQEYTAGDVFLRLIAAAKEAKSEAALAREIGCTKQHISDVMHGRKPVGPAVLGFLRLQRVEHPVRFIAIDGFIAEPKPKPPRSPRRQAAWDMLPRVSATQTDNQAVL